MSETPTRRRTVQLSGRLTDLQLRNLVTRDRQYKVSDGNSLYVLVSPSGSGRGDGSTCSAAGRRS